MIREKISLQDAVDLMNEIVSLDKKAAERLIFTRVECNEALNDHHSIQVHNEENNFSVGILGVLNGLFGIADDGFGAIAAVFDDSEGDLLRFEIIRNPEEGN